MILDGLKPESVFYYFEEICKIPHGSGNTKAISDYVVSVANELELKSYQDEVNNVIIYKDGVGEGADKPPVILQGHLDMVCEKNFETNPKFDFTKDPLNLCVMDDYIYAKGTTLGGDDGIAVAYMLAILADKDFIAPPLECVFTVDEEVGMDGAKALDFSKISGKSIINIDQEEEGIILSSCAGGMSSTLSLSVSNETKTGVKYTIVICGLAGGHSGTEINKYRANANLVMGRLLHQISESVHFDLISVNGGLQDNAIPRECRAEILVSAEDIEKIDNIISEFENIIHKEYQAVEKNACIYGEVDNDESETVSVISDSDKDKVIFILMTLPNGVYKMSSESDNLVKTSSNVGIVRLNKEKFEINISLRSSLESEKHALSNKIKCIVKAAGGDYVIQGEYPAWEYNEDSHLRDIVFDAFQRVYDRNPMISGIHAGLETGIFYKNIENADIVSIGPDIEDIHTPKEKLSISSVGRTYSLLVEILRDLAFGY